ncbi:MULTISPECIES: hypothetical protein [Methylobacterium]|uniref:hypothetical protein n=1 Tax=Methylobacterium TaxID=407 RepID=UPI0013ED0E5D|nr:hypothetical protein [Methylobacterium sp. DB0501]NGM38285.1 hypothetical protein [Methylobacterium sp. DB0501]
MVETAGGAARRLLASIDRHPGRVVADGRLPLAHPLDADWRFTRDSAEHILDRLLARTPAAADILLIAMPTIALAAHDRGLMHRIVVASRIGDPIDLALRKVMPGCRFVSLQKVPMGAFQTVALDPPWYDDVALPIIEIARAAALPNGRIFVCTPDTLTSPSSAKILSKLMSEPHEVGFSIVESVERIRYATPFFELQCLKAAGISNVSPVWRTGLLCSCIPEPLEFPTCSVCPPVRGAWREVRYGAIRIWLRQPAVQGPAAVGVADSISRTDRTRKIANLWTSGNTYVAGVDVIGLNLLSGTVDGAAQWPWENRLKAVLSDELATMEQAVEFW